MTGRCPYIPEEVSPDKLSLILEPEAAAFYCQNMILIQQAMYCTAKAPFTSKNFVVVDVGGGTVDIVAYRINLTPEPHIEVIHHPAGDAWGGTKVNQEFKKLLIDIIRDKDFSRYVKTPNEATNALHMSHLNELIYETFEAQKNIFGDKELDNDGQISVHLPYTFFEQYRSNLTSISPKLQENVTLRGIELRITYSTVKEFYKPVVKGIIESITQVLESSNVKTDTIYLVGGFGGCHYVYEAIKSHFGDRYNYITPDSREYAVIKGAVLMRMNPQLIQSRRVDATYGVRVSIPFVEGKHAKEYRYTVNTAGKCCDKCANIFSTFVEKDDIVCAEDAYMMTYIPESKSEKQMHVEIYSSPEKDVWYVTGRPPTQSIIARFADVQKIGQLIIPFPEHNRAEVGDQEVDVFFDFTSTEIQVKGYERQSQTEVKVVIDFLSG